MLTIVSNLSAQNLVDTASSRTDTIMLNPDQFTPACASSYIRQLIGKEDLWKEQDDSLKLSLIRLLEHYNEPFDSVRARLERFPFDAVELKPAVIVHSDTLPLRWLGSDLFIIDTILLDREPFIIQKTIVIRTIDTLALPILGTVPEMRELIDSLLLVRDTLTDVMIDFKYLEDRRVQWYHVENERTVPPLIQKNGHKTTRFTADSTRIIVSETSPVLMAGPESPFFIIPNENMPDSLKLAVEALLAYTFERDSIPLMVYDIRGRKTPYWLTSGKDDLYRYWVTNANDDSVTLWLGNPSKFDITMILEEDVFIERMGKKPVEMIPVITASPDTKLARVTPLKEIPVFWSFGLSSSFSVNWNYLVNWAQGGESSFSGMFDISGRAVYTHKEKNQQWTNSGRLRYGTVRTKEYDFRTNTDIIELNSQYNKKLWKKIDFSSSFYFKTQMAKGYKYPNDSTVVSKFMNPGTFTIGTGIEYKPFKDTQLNFSVLSYKNTFVLDTAHINQKTHGIDDNKRARQEMGGQLVIRNKVNILDGLSISNTLRLFSNYLNKPQNIDVDWEMNLERQITWFLYIRLNIHLIYDDDIRFPATDESGEPILLTDGSQKMVPKTQYNQFLGLTFAFRI
ncbi:MAG: DUF3078 domain-containing protein [Bacteroidales bacterium]